MVTIDRRIYPFSMKIAVHPLTANPTKAWQELSQRQKVITINATLPTTEAPSDKVYIISQFSFYFHLCIQ